MQNKTQNLFLLIFILLMGLIGCYYIFYCIDKPIAKQADMIIKPKQITDSNAEENAIAKEEENHFSITTFKRI